MTAFGYQRKNVMLIPKKIVFLGMEVAVFFLIPNGII